MLMRRLDLSKLYSQGAVSKARGCNQKVGGNKGETHSQRLSCSPSAYHGVSRQDLYVEFIVAESALLDFMDVFRRSAAARVIYRLSLLPSILRFPSPTV